MNKHNFKFFREIKDEFRFFEILNSMRKPNISYDTPMDNDFNFQVHIFNTGGVVLYTYTHAGLVGMNGFKNKLFAIREGWKRNA